MLQHIHKPIIPQLNYTLIEKKHITSTVKSNIEQKSQHVINKSNITSTINYEQEKCCSKNFQQQNFNISAEDYDPLAVTFIDPKNQISRTIPPLTSNLEPKSLDLTPVNDSLVTFDDEFSDFQCAQFTHTDNTNNHEFEDFQTAFDSLSFKENPKCIEKEIELLNDGSSSNTIDKSFESQTNCISYQDDVHDKYEVFRTLAAEIVDIEDLVNDENQSNFLDAKPIESIKENIQSYDVNDDEFGDFLCVEEVSSNKPEIEVNWKNVQVCIN